jgi:glucose/arabinose dehydrogenase
MRRASALLCTVTVLILARCTNSATSPPGSSPAVSRTSPIGTPQVVADHLDTPWGVTFLPDGDALVGERNSGRILRVDPSGTTTVVTTIRVSADGESGLLGLARSPDFAHDHLVFAYYTSGTDNRLVRFTLTGTRAGALDPILTGVPRGAIHDGGRIAFGPEGMLYIGTGETGDSALAQQRDSLAGKILRIRPDGSVPPDNPFPGSPVWTLGHRNVQGLAWDVAGRMFSTEFGPDRADEINRIRPGKNYGWPEVVGTGGADSGFVDPLVTFPTGQNSASGLAITDGALWTAALRGERLWRIPERADGSLGTPQPLLVGRYGRLRTVVLAPNGDLWVTTSNRDGRGDPSKSDDRILRIPIN